MVNQVRILALLLLIVTHSAWALTCEHAYKGKQIDAATLKTLIAAHQQWLDDPSKGQQLNLCGTDLSRVDLTNLNLTRANFAGSDLSYSKLNNTNLSRANLEKTFFRWTQAENADFSFSNLRQADFQEANLQNTLLRQAQMQQANLTRADLSNINASGVNLQAAKLGETKLIKATFNWANLSKADISDSQLQHASLQHAQLQQTNFSNSNLTNTDFSAANLTAANFNQAIISNAKFDRSQLNQVIYQPDYHSLPDLIPLTEALHFRHIQFDLVQGAPSLVALRNAYRKIGMRNMERQISATLKTREMQHALQQGGMRSVEGLLSYVFFYTTSDYGAAPGRVLQIFLGFIVLFTLPYMFAVLRASSRHGIIIQWPARHLKTVDIIAQSATPDVLQRWWRAPQYGWFYRYWVAFRMALFFSVLSAFQIGWQDFNLSHWISRIQPREYTLKARGWVRVFAGSQALISAYLLILWALCYFGRPFEW